FNQTNPDHLEDLSIAGKVMAFIAKGQPREALIEQFESIVKNHLELSLNFPHSFVQRFKSNDDGQFSNEDILASMHVFLQRKLLDGLGKQLVRHSFKTHNICLTGGCALNIKWNSAIRNSGLFSNVWVHPFPNDSGSALGAACAKLMEVSAHRSIRWNVYQGPTVSRTKIGENWHQYSGDATQLAELLAKVQKPVVIIDGPAELGPRALGSRSILAPAHSPEMKDILNRIKNREPYRPVAPICLEEDAPAIFDPGSADPYMLFDHQVRKDWIERIPAVIHLDGTARLQTVGKHDNPFLYELLREYKKITSVPVLCNTSANYSGKGFFPDVRSVMEWGMVNYIWSNGQIYIKEGFQHHFETLSPTKDLVGSE
ncbi:MAG: carbamoyltransferase C-terminal domain-containing protein, partial [Ekhidna sp.]